MLTKTEYVCEICRRAYSDIDSAIACERRGVFDPADQWPAGMIFAYRNEPGDIYAGMTFAVAKYDERPDDVRKSHGCTFGAWACRDNRYGDSLNDQMCGCHEHGELTEYHANADPDLSTFRRMVEYLNGRGIAPTVWDGTRPVPLAEWLERRKS